MEGTLDRHTRELVVMKCHLRDKEGEDTIRATIDILPNLSDEVTCIATTYENKAVSIA